MPNTKEDYRNLSLKLAALYTHSVEGATPGFMEWINQALALLDTQQEELASANRKIAALAEYAMKNDGGALKIAIEVMRSGIELPK